MPLVFYFVNHIIIKTESMKENGKGAFTPEFVESLEEGQVFVFGSNLVGCHSGGASQMALQRFGAVWGQAEGPQGECYAIPVDIRGEAVGNVSVYMQRHIDKFIAYARTHQDRFFLVTRIGCGAAGFDEEFMAPFFKEALKMENVSLPESFVKIVTKKEEKTDKRDGTTQRVYNLIILDESGSMATIAKRAVSGLNETFQTISAAQKEHQEQQHFISFVTFNSAHIMTVMDRLPVDTNRKLEWRDFVPNNCTPLFDAMGQSLDKLREHVAEEDVVLVTIITDGMENASQRYSGHDIKRLVASLKEKGWVFAYIGTNQDVDAVADDMGIRSRMYYEYSDRGASEMFEKEHRSKREFYARLHREGRNFMKEESYDYFKADDEENAENGADVARDMNSNAATDQEQEEHKGLWGGVKEFFNFLKS